MLDSQSRLHQVSSHCTGGDDCILVFVISSGGFLVGFRHSRWTLTSALAVFLCLCVAAFLGADEKPGSSATADAFQQQVAPFLKRNCVLCHQQKNATAGLDLSSFASAAVALQHPEVWEKVSARILDGTMPPKGLPSPPMEQRDAVVGWIRDGLEQLARNTKPDPGRVTARRLNRVEYNNTVRDLLGVDFQPASSFPADDAGYGFDNIGDVLSVSPVLMEKYVDAAWEIAQRAIVSPLDRMEPTYARINGEDLRRIGKDASTVDGELAFPHAREASYDFPADAEYEITLRVADRRRKKDSAGLMALTVVGHATPQVFETQLPSGGEDPPNEFSIRVRVPAGKQTLRAATVGAEMQARVYHDEADASRFIDAGHFEVRGPFGEPRRAITHSHRQIFVCSPRSKAEQPACASRILKRLARLAYRRPVTEADVKPHISLAAEARAEGFPFEEQIRLALQGVLVSPQFLFRIERGGKPVGEGDVRALTPVELASRLSYFLWSSMPDEALLSAAERGELQTREQVRSQVQRMLAHPKSRALTENFAGQWLRLRNIDLVQPDRDLFPEFDASLRRAMKRETELMFEALLHEGGTVDDILVGEFTFLNERLAKHYGISGVNGEEFRRVPLAGTRRGGMLTHASLLTISSYPTRTSPVLRGLWLLESVIGAPPPPPPPDVPELDAEGVGEAATLRERMEKHRGDPTCAACHSKMDPLGFSLENYDAIGRYRETEGKFPIDASGTLPDGVSFDGPEGMKRALLGQRRQIAANLAEKMLTFALGRGLERYDRAAVETLTASMEANQYRIATLVEEICWSMPFRMRRGEGVAQP
ncbi:MAG: DUF1592 domain-containing protein [Bryobacterales bacterium]|nr:DUF1592 domain-containing protein [Bryobacterales bacterium]